MLTVSIFLLLYLQKALGLVCEQKCPSDKPFCSDVGCIFDCPEPFYINGSRCVSTCGDWFVDDNRNCVESCPIKTYHEDRLRLVETVQYLERKCVRCNEYNQFIFNESCVRACPTEYRYIDLKRCVDRCPTDRPLKVSRTLLNIPHYICVIKCPYLVEDTVCRSNCSNDKVIFNSTCVENCPSSSPFLYSRICVSECPKNAPSAGHENATCLKHSCPIERPYVLNNTCIEKCPYTEALTFTLNGFNYCVKSCKEGQYRLDDTCVDRCPPLTVAINNRCHDQCPKETPFSCVVSKGIECGEQPVSDHKYAVCIYECPSGMFTWNKTCVFNCPVGIPVFGDECVSSCPQDYPLQNNITMTEDCGYGRCRKATDVLTCVKYCPSDAFSFDNTCAPYCQSPLLQNDNECVSSCPGTKPLILNSEVKITVWNYDRYSYYDSRKYRKETKSMAVKKCTSSCGDRMVIFNSTCLNSCPDDYPYLHDGTCSELECGEQFIDITQLRTVCVEKCRSDQFVMNRTCVPTCPSTNKHFNGTCVDQCPENHSYTTITEHGYFCVQNCPDGFYLHKNDCVRYCRPNLFIHDNKCVGACPTRSPYTNSSAEKVETWINDGSGFTMKTLTVNIVKCVSSCPKGKVILGFKCVDICPASLRFLVNETCTSDPCKETYKYSSRKGIVCYENCPKDLFVVNNTCMLQCPDDLYSLGQNCVTNCPSTYNLLEKATVGIDEYNCTESGIASTCTSEIIHTTKCQSRCSDRKYLFNKTCVDFCPEGTHVYNSNCLSTCPKSHSFIQDLETISPAWEKYNDFWMRTLKHHYPVSKLCVSKCPDKYPLQFKNKCVTQCPWNTPFSLDFVCVESCPENKLSDAKTKTCVDKCASDIGLLNKTCYFNCPQSHRHIYNSRCVEKCPPSAPVSLEEDRFICRKSCPDDKLWKEGKCIYNFQCDDPMFGFEGICVSVCPEGFVWFHVCRKTQGAKIAIPVLVVVLVVLLGCSWRSIMEFFSISRLMFVSEEKMKEFENDQRQLHLKTVGKRNKRDDETPLWQTFFENEIEDHHSLRIDTGSSEHSDTDVCETQI